MGCRTTRDVERRAGSPAGPDKTRTLRTVVVEEGREYDGTSERRWSCKWEAEEVAVTAEDIPAGAPAEVYRRYLEGGTLGFQRCEGCSSAVFYPRVLCSSCGSSSLLWETSSGRGIVYATTSVYRRDAEPYNVALVDLEEGFRMMSRVERVPAEEIEVGMKVTFAVRAGDEGPIAVFEPEDGA
jgi:uncharacterized OB-fold protein